MRSDEHVFERAVAFAANAHAGQRRKGKKKPFILHPLEVSSIVGTLTDDGEVLAAAVLHDTVEDAGVTAEELADAFGERVAALVADESEDKREDQPAEDTWRIRKEETIEHMKRACREAKMICLGDKLANLREIRADYAAAGDELWARFNQRDPAMHAWYYGSLLSILAEEFGEDHPAISEYRSIMDRVFGMSRE